MASSYKCTSVGCYSYQNPETNTLFQRLQTVVNQFAGAAMFDPIKVDGIIGKGTTEKALLVLTYLSELDSGVVGGSARALESGINGPEQLAGNAQAVIDTLTLAAKQSPVASQVTQPAPLPAPTPQPSPTQIATSTANAPAKTTNAQTQHKLNLIRIGKPDLAASLLDRVPPIVAYIGGAALAASAIAAVVISKKRKAAGSPAAPVAGRW